MTIVKSVKARSLFMKRFRIYIVQTLIQLLENLFFYPKLRRFYADRLSVTPFIIDVGANKGQSISFFKRIRPDAIIHAFEANPYLVEKLRRLHSKYSSLVIVAKGVSSMNGKKIFNVNAMDETSSFEELNYSSKYLKKKAAILGLKQTGMIDQRVEVEVIKLRDYLLQEDISEIDLVKIDTEGHELHCIQGLLEGGVTKIRRIQFECHEDDMYKNSDSLPFIFELLRENNFIIERKFVHPFGQIHEYIFVFNADA